MVLADAGREEAVLQGGVEGIRKMVAGIDEIGLPV